MESKFLLVLAGSPEYMAMPTGALGMYHDPLQFFDLD